MIINLEITPEYDPSLHEIVRLFYPDSEIIHGADAADLHIDISAHGESERITVDGRLWGCVEWSENLEIRAADRADLKREIRCFVYSLIGRAKGEDPSPYGILTGIRPTKLIHKMFDRGLTREEAVREIGEKYLVHPREAQLLTGVAANNRACLPDKEKARRTIGVYIGIPYCPSRCSYCSFPGYPLGYKPGLEQYLEALLWEVGTTGTFLRQQGFSINNLYIGGGTPTVLNVSQWQRLLAVIAELAGDISEFTVEAGRPETLDWEVLDLLRDAGVNRICINPQTMNEDTLDLIGRRHTVQEVESAFSLARSAGFVNINMDLIVGLPGEGPEVFAASLDRILELAPEGITVHVLALKRGSKWVMEGIPDAGNNKDNARETVREAYKRLISEGYVPYYLYRQKHMAGNLENIGYARPGHYGLYNIQIIEERQTVVGMGGGSSSKYVDANDWSLTSMYHPKDPLAYVNNVKTLVSRQVDKLKALS